MVLLHKELELDIISIEEKSFVTFSSDIDPHPSNDPFY